MRALPSLGRPRLRPGAAARRRPLTRPPSGVLRRHERPTQPDHRDRPVGRRSSSGSSSSTRCRGSARRSSGRRRSRPSRSQETTTAPARAGRGARRRRPSAPPAQPMTRAEALAALAAGADRQRRHPRLDRAQGRPHRRRHPGPLPRDRRPELARDRAAEPARRAAPLLRRVWLGAGDAGTAMPGPETLWTAEGGELTAKDAGDACTGTTARG